MRLRLPLIAVALGLACAAPGCGTSDEPTTPGGPAVAEDPGPVHVHGLGVNPRDGALFIATHTGLFRLADPTAEAVRVADRHQDTMGFTVIGPDRFLGSGHPDGREGLPPFLGLIESRDAGQTWEPVSLLGKADFHVLEARGRRVYGFGSDWESRRLQFLASDNGGESWEEIRYPQPLLSLAIHPTDPDRLVASGTSRLYLSSDGGRSWRPTEAGASLVAWPAPNELIRIDGSGAAWSSTNEGSPWIRRGSVGGRPAAFEAESDGLYVALHDGTVKKSTDDGVTWRVYFRP